MTEKIYDVDLWMQYIRPDDFEFQGFMVMRLVDVTEQEMLSSIKYDLLKKNAVSEEASFTTIQHKLRSLFGIQEIQLGLAYCDTANNLIITSSSCREVEKLDADDERGLTLPQLRRLCLRKKLDRKKVHHSRKFK